ncbi:hypothetical protein RF11_14949 [Thelohanellus kitauei]|uniref:FLYWCH-type domain-containing protein n=1 Tax=Thelohanellus kitauei TaxID=669202 RepID=A0A0C2IZ37_THEKT|nr:hypothetical protein RF11_14949 [Thelohanellus kitauei]
MVLKCFYSQRDTFEDIYLKHIKTAQKYEEDEAGNAHFVAAKVADVHLKEFNRASADYLTSADCFRKILSGGAYECYHVDIIYEKEYDDIIKSNEFYEMADGLMLKHAKKHLCKFTKNSMDAFDQYISKSLDTNLKDGYVYHKESQGTLYTFWRCANYNKSKCRGRCKTDQTRFVLTRPHSHGPNISHARSREVLSQIRHAARSTQQTNQQILAHATASLSEAVIGALPPLRNITDTIQYTRRVENAPLPLPQTYDNLVIPEEYKPEEDF